MVQTLAKNWWLLVMCGGLYGVISVIYLIMQDTNGPLMFHEWGVTIARLGELTLAAGACSIAAGLWKSSDGKCWPLVVNGVALGALGLICTPVAGRYSISLLTVAMLVVLMAVSIGALEMVMARTRRQQLHNAEGWLLGLAGLVSVGFALPFLALGFHWVRLGPGSHLDFLWLGFYFGFSAICILGLGLRLHSRSGFESGDA